MRPVQAMPRSAPVLNRGVQTALRKLVRNHNKWPWSCTSMRGMDVKAMLWSPRDGISSQDRAIVQKVVTCPGETRKRNCCTHTCIGAGPLGGVNFIGLADMLRGREV